MSTVALFSLNAESPNARTRPPLSTTKLNCHVRWVSFCLTKQSKKMNKNTHVLPALLSHVPYLMTVRRHVYLMQRYIHAPPTTSPPHIKILYPCQLLKITTSNSMSAATVSLRGSVSAYIFSYYMSTVLASLCGLNTSKILTPQSCLARFSLCGRNSYVNTIWLTRFCLALLFKYSKSRAAPMSYLPSTASCQIIIFCYFQL